LKEIQEDRKRVSREKKEVEKALIGTWERNLGEEHCWRRRSKISLSGADDADGKIIFALTVRGGLILTCKINYLQRCLRLRQKSPESDNSPL
jgi:hypothetical protein